MNRTRVPGNDPTLPEPHAHGYLMVVGKPVDITAYNASHAWAAGGIVSTANDLNLFYAALLTGVLLEPAELRAMMTIVPMGNPDMTAGLGIARIALPDGVTVWGNGGGFFGYNTWSFHTANADRQLTVSATTARGERPSTLDILTRALCPADARR
jgi:D-alanyl-D-alanine carboxypeptidase